jgi:FkbM family methyltransferase
MRPVTRLAKRLLEAATAPFVRRLVTAAYAHPNGPSHRRIQRAARSWYGLDRCGPLGRIAGRWFIDFVFQVQQERSLRERVGVLAAPSPIGFDGLMIECSAADANSSVVYLYGFSDNVTSFALYRRYAMTGTVAIDIGANLGLHALVLSRCVGSQGRVFAYEPFAPIYRRLTANVGLNHAVNIVTRPYGLGERTGTMRFNDHVGEFNIGKGRVASEGNATIEIRALDDELRGVNAPVSLVKIDVEGFELAVLKGAQETLRRHTPVILMEYNPSAYRLSDIAASLPYPVRYEQVPATSWDALASVEPDGVRDRVDLLITPAARA